jgi:hypothetical protein
MKNTEIIIEILGNSSLTEEQQEIHDFIDYLEDKGISIPDNIYHNLVNTGKPQYEILETHVTNNWFYLSLLALPKDTKAIRIRTAQKDIPSEHVITKDEMITKYGKDKVWSWPNGDWSYYDADNWEHLMRQIGGKWVELTEGIKAKWIWFYKNGDWSYKDGDDWKHLMREINGKWIELTDGIKAKCVCSYENGDWRYDDEDDWEHLMRQIEDKWVELTEGIKAKCVCSYDNRDWSYEDEKGKWHDVKFDPLQYK